MSGTSASSPIALPNDQIVTIPIEALTSSGAVTALPTGDVDTVTSSVPLSFNAVLGVTAAGLPAIVVNALVDGSLAPTTVYEVTLSDSAGLTPASLFFIIVSDTTPTSLFADFPDATHVSQPVPPPG